VRYVLQAAQRRSSAARRRVGIGVTKLKSDGAHSSLENRGDSGESAARIVGPLPVVISSLLVVHCCCTRMMNAVIALATACGWVIVGTCPAPGTIIS
jgi:hypothetical protein